MFYSKFPTHSKQCSTLGNINVFFPVDNMESGAPKAGTWCRVRMPESESIVKRALNSSCSNHYYPVKED